MKIKDLKGKELLAIDVFSKAEIRNEDIKLVLEPEAASLYCNINTSCKIVKFDGKVGLESFPVGHRYIVADLGGGTADLAVHEILDDHNLREIARSDGDAYGGVLVDNALQEFLSEFFGRDVIQTLIEQQTHGYMEFRRKFESKKRGFKSDVNAINIKLPLWDLKDAFEACNHCYDVKPMQSTQERLNLCTMGFFDTAVDGIVKFIQQIRTTDELGMIHTILMFGGFSESKYVQERIENEIPGVRLVIPTDPSLAVLKGAVLYGKTPRAITERIARFSYGFSVGRPFEEGIDPEELKYTKNGKKYCGSIFEKLITKGQILKQGQIFSDKINYFLDTDTDLSSMLSKAPAAAPIFKSTKVDPSKYSTAEDCEEIGKLIILPPPTGWPLVSVFDHVLIVGESELQAFARNNETNQMHETTLDCL
ncbi:HS12B-like protein [Mya arenaria]|uniref:HS12B-like protein n=1 Tax=Mya arenaria TaxID=6604 RepID=A0ABY7ESI6_MYAAR|nr:HS12B-like protein [Mya arenaria]